MNMKKILLTALLALFFLSSCRAQTVFTFECFCGYLTVADGNCDVCGPTLQSRMFTGIIIRRNGVPHKWIETPYTVRFNGQVARFQELVYPNPEIINIDRSQTPYGTLDSFKMAIQCPCVGGGGRDTIVIDSSGAVCAALYFFANDTAAIASATTDQYDYYLTAPENYYGLPAGLVKLAWETTLPDSANAPGCGSGGGGGGSDALGTGFTSGGGGGSIPAETVAQMQGRFDIDNQDVNILRIGDVNGAGSNLRLEISPDGITLGDGDYVFGAIPGDDIMTLTSPGGIFFAGATGLEAYVKEAANSGFKITDNQVVKTGAYYAGDYSATLATNDRSIPDVGTVKIIIQSGPPQYTTTQRDALSPSAGWTIYCTDCTANDSSTGVTQTYNGTTWKNHW